MQRLLSRLQEQLQSTASYSMADPISSVAPRVAQILTMSAIRGPMSRIAGPLT